jgi:hypothetical protein
MQKHRVFKLGAFCIALLGQYPFGVAFGAEPSLPNASLEVTVRQKQDGTIGKGLYLFHLLCWNSECSLTTLSLNQCGPAGSGRQAFYPTIRRTSTIEENLRVRKFGSVLEAQQVVQDIGGESTMILRFTYGIDGSSTVANRVTAFSGGHVQNSTILGRVTTVEYIPLVMALSEVVLDCAVHLPGVERQK